MKFFLITICSFAVAATAFQIPAPGVGSLRLRSQNDEGVASPVETMESVVKDDLDLKIERFAASMPVPSESRAAARDKVTDQKISDDLKKDIERFRKMKTTVTEDAGANALVTVVNGLGVVLSVNFVIIVSLFLWFLFGCFQLFALNNDTVIVSVKNNFDPYILPVLSTHMALTFLSAALERIAGVE